MTATPLETTANGAVTPNPAGSRRHRRAFWAVAFAFFTVMGFSTVPSPLYGLYRTRDHFSIFMITVLFAVSALGAPPDYANSIVDARGVRPFRVAEPLLWLLSQFQVIPRQRQK